MNVESSEGKLTWNHYDVPIFVAIIGPMAPSTDTGGEFWDELLNQLGRKGSLKISTVPEVRIHFKFFVEVVAFFVGGLA